MYKSDEVYRYSAEELRVTDMHCLRLEVGTASTYTVKILDYFSIVASTVLFCLFFLFVFCLFCLLLTATPLPLL